MSPIPDGGIPPAPVPPQFPPAIPSIDYGARFRTGLLFQDPDKLDSLKKAYGLVDMDIYFAGQLHRMVKWQAGVTASIYPTALGTATGATTTSPNVQLLDVIAKIEPIPEFSVWMGRMIIMADRWTASGPWGMDEFIFPGRFTAPTNLIPGGLLFAGPKGGTNLRDWGVTLWGSFAGGYAKYFLQAMQLEDPRIPPLYTGRIQLNFLSPEPGFYHRTTYYGTKDLLAVGFGGQIQGRGVVTKPAVAPMPMAMPPVAGSAAQFDTWKMLDADIIFEKTFGDAGTLSLDGSIALFDGGAGAPGGSGRNFNNSMVAGIGYLLPGVVGIGKLRPSVRYQRAQFRAAGADASQIIDAQIGYVVMGWWARLALGYRYTSTDISKAVASATGHAIFIGITIADP